MSLSKTTRIILGIASLLLLITYFVPLWQILLWAPQYPEGLTMKIWMHTLTGEVNIINGLNHYIGMKHISVEMFPEFRFLGILVGFLIAVGLAAAVGLRLDSALSRFWMRSTPRWAFSLDGLILKTRCKQT